MLDSACGFYLVYLGALMKLNDFLLCSVLCVSHAVAQQFTNTNQSVIKMVKAGMSDPIIISSINSQPAHFSLSANDLIALKQAGVSDQIMAAMIARSNPAAVPASAVPALYPTEIGVYYKVNGAYTDIEPEIVNQKTGGFLKSLATDGIIKPDINGHVNGVRSRTSLNSNVEFLFVVPDGDSLSEYQLLRLHAKSNYREFRSVTGGVIHASTGATRDDISFKGTKVAPRTYLVTLGPNTPAGEYGFLPPGAFTSRNLASSGKMYTFHLTE